MLDNQEVEGALGKTLSSLLAKGIPFAQAMERARAMQAQEQAAIQADARNPATPFTSASGNRPLPESSPDFERALSSAIARGIPPDKALALARQTIDRSPKKVHNANTALADGGDVDTMLSLEGKSRIFKVTLGNALNKGMPVAQAIALANKAEAANAFRFPLSGQAAQLADTKGKLEITLPNGKPLPPWLRYVAQTKSFVASEVPEGAFPMTVTLRAEGKQANVTISETPVPVNKALPRTTP